MSAVISSSRTCHCGPVSLLFSSVGFHLISHHTRPKDTHDDKCLSPETFLEIVFVVHKAGTNLTCVLWRIIGDPKLRRRRCMCGQTDARSRKRIQTRMFRKSGKCNDSQKCPLNYLIHFVTSRNTHTHTQLRRRNMGMVDLGPCLYDFAQLWDVVDVCRVHTHNNKSCESPTVFLGPCDVMWWSEKEETKEPNGCGE